MAHLKGRKSAAKQDKKRGAAKQAFKKKNAKARHDDLREKIDRTVLEEKILHKVSVYHVSRILEISKFLCLDSWDRGFTDSTSNYFTTSLKC